MSKDLTEKLNAVLESNESLFKTIQVLKKRLVEVAEENAKLKELLKECREAIVNGYMDCEYRAKIALKIDEVLK